MNSNVQEVIADNLFNYSIARDDIKAISSGIPDCSSQEEQTYIFELQILKIISIGVSINYLLDSNESKVDISEKYWKNIMDFSNSINDAAGTYSDVSIDYLSEIRRKLDYYLKELNSCPGSTEPASVIGPAFAFQCGDKENTFAVLAGARIFKTVVSGVRQYFQEEGYI